MTEDIPTLLETLANKIKNRITTHNSNNTSHPDLRTLINGKANSTHTHTKNQITDFPALATVATSGSYNDLSNKPTLSSLSTQSEELKIGDIESLSTIIALYLAQSSTTINLTGGATGKPCAIEFDRIGKIALFRIYATYGTSGWSGSQAPYVKSNVGTIPDPFKPKRDCVFHMNNYGTNQINGMLELDNNGQINVKTSDKTKDILYYSCGAYMTDYSPFSGGDE